jgi:Ca2+/Na+ antiporter
MKINILTVFYVTGLLLVILASIGHFFEIQYSNIVFAIGASMLVIERIIVMLREKETDFRKQRLLRMNLMLSLVLVLAAYSMLDGTTLWIPAVLIYALITLFLSFRT